MAEETSKEKTSTEIKEADNPLDSLEDNIIVAPYSLALLGQVILLSTKRDFSLISKPSINPDDVRFLESKGDFKYITHPESFRATLVQVSNAGYHAFLAAHSNMDKIRLACDNAQQHVELITECVIEGENSDITTLVPGSLQAMRETAQECKQWSQDICNKFHSTLELLEEVHCSCHATQMTNQDKLEELDRQKKAIESERKENENNKIVKQKRLEELEVQMENDRKEHEKEFEKRQQSIRGHKKDIIEVENELEEFKLKQEKAANEVEEARNKRGIWQSFVGSKTDEMKIAERMKQERDYEVREKNQKFLATEKKSKNEVEYETKMLEENRKEKNLKINEKSQEKRESMDKMEALSEKISAAIIKLNSTDVTKLDIEGIKQLLREGIEKVAELEEHWKKLVIFFEEVSNITEVAMGKAIKDFTNAAEKANDKVVGSDEGSNPLTKFTKKSIMKLAYKAYASCNGVSSVSKTYLMISRNYLMPSIVDLGTLVALDPERDAEKIKAKTQAIQERSRMTVEYVKEVVSHAKLENETVAKMKQFQLKK